MEKGRRLDGWIIDSPSFFLPPSMVSLSKILPFLSKNPNGGRRMKKGENSARLRTQGRVRALKRSTLRDAQ
ncbi:exonuclease A [Sesbania bispinosa]|nr:exonuclease A [Sesbania bispinosa]